MIVNTKTGLLLAGTIGKTPELKFVGQNERPVLKFPLRYGSEEDSTGKRRGKFVDVDVWNGAEELDGMFSEDDAVIVTAREIKSREYNGKTYYSVSADGVYPGAAVVFRWLQQVIDCIPAGPPGAPAEFTPVDAPVPAEFNAPGDLTGHELYPGEQLSDHAPSTSAGKTTPVQMKLGDAPIEEAEDLPF